MSFSSFGHYLKSLFIKYYAVIIGLVVIIVLFGGYQLFIKDIFGQIQKLGSEGMKAKQQELSVKKETVIRWQALSDKYEQITSAEMKQLSSILPHEADIPYLVIELKNFIQKNKLVLDALDAGPLSVTTGGNAVVTTVPPAVAPTVKKLNISLSIHKLDSYAGLKTFLDELSKNLPVLELTSISYSPGSDSYSLNLTTYYQ